MRKLKILDRGFNLHGFKFDFPLCCVIWFCNIDCTLRSTLPEYSESMHILSNNEGRILCPDCIIRKLKH